MNRYAYTLTRSLAGRISAKTETVTGAAINYAYTYDDLGRLITVTKDGALVEQYQYDAIGRRTYEMNSQRGIADRAFVYSDEDHLLTAGETTYQYDLDGFLTTKTNLDGATAYTYSSRGELLKAILPDGKITEYLHDPQGRCIAKKVNGVITEKYLWQGMTRLLAVYNGSNSLLMRFQYGDGRMPVAMTKGGVTYYLGYDQVGSLRAVTEASGNIVKKVEYDAFGNILIDSNTAFAVPFGFAGGLHDGDTGLVKFGYRDYDPEIGRWTAKDPIAIGGNIYTRGVNITFSQYVEAVTNSYAYVQNNPILWIDPYGLVAYRYTGPAYFVPTGEIRTESYRHQTSTPVPTGLTSLFPKKFTDFLGIDMNSEFTTYKDFEKTLVKRPRVMVHCNDDGTEELQYAESEVMGQGLVEIPHSTRLDPNIDFSYSPSFGPPLFNWNSTPSK